MAQQIKIESFKNISVTETSLEGLINQILIVSIDTESQKALVHKISAKHVYGIGA